MISRADYDIDQGISPELLGALKGHDRKAGGEMIKEPKRRIHLNLSRHDAATLFVILTQAMDESTGEQDGMLLEEDLDCADRIAARLWDMLQDPRQARPNIFSA